MKRKFTETNPDQNQFPLNDKKQKEVFPDAQKNADEKHADLQARLRTLTKAQRLVIKKVVENRENVFLTGGAGVGKTFVLRIIQDLLLEKGLRVATTATTGIAACALLGCTLHHWMGLGLAQEDDDFLIQKAKKSFIASRWIKTDVLIIDEMSMMKPRILHILDLIARTLRRSDAPFGGLQVIGCGDFTQLPPVYTQEEKKWNDLTFVFQHPKWNEYFQQGTIHLTENFRQKMDDELYKRLATLRFATHEPEDDAYWRKNMRILPKEMDSIVTKLFPTNKEADRVNEQKLLEICPDKKQWKTFLAVTHETDKFSRDNSEASLFIKNMQQSCLAQTQVVLALGARVMLVVNRDDHLVNGTCGTIVGWGEPSVWKHFPKQRYPIVEFEILDGSKQKLEMVPHSWEYRVKGRLLASYSQVPLKLAWALTIHKAQGMTLQKVALDLTRIFEHGQSYTGLSRITNIQGLWLTGYKADRIRCHPDVIKFYAAF